MQFEVLLHNLRHPLFFFLSPTSSRKKSRELDSRRSHFFPPSQASSSYYHGINMAYCDSATPISTSQVHNSECVPIIRKFCRHRTTRRHPLFFSLSPTSRKKKGSRARFSDSHFFPPSPSPLLSSFSPLSLSLRLCLRVFFPLLSLGIQISFSELSFQPRPPRKSTPQGTRPRPSLASRAMAKKSRAAGL